jgi:photosystem II stability/assembly factor-like uncharacterized protein
MVLATRRLWRKLRMASSRKRLPGRPQAVSASKLVLEALEERTLLSASIPLSAATWTAIGPASLTEGDAESGRITAIAPSPSDPNTIYIASASGGVWKTTNAGGAWTPLTDHQATLNMGAIAVAPSNPNVIYAGTGEDTLGPSKLAISRDNIYYGLGVLKSTDAGATWTLEGATQFYRRSIARIVIDPTNANVVYVAVGNVSTNGLPGNTGIWKSTDGGATWTDTTATISTTAAFTDLAMSPDNNQVLYAAVGSDAGNTANGLYVTTNGGASWASVVNFPRGTFDNNLGRTLLAIAPGSSQTIYASIAHSGANATLYRMMKSVDGGTTWSILGNTPEYMFGFGDYNDALAVDPADPNDVFAAGSPGAGTVIRSTDGGNSWVDISSDSTGYGPHVDQHALVFDASGKLLDGNDGGIWRLDNATPGSLKWTDLNSNLGTLQINGVGLDPTSLNVAYAGAQDNGLEKFTDNRQWNSYGLGGDGGFIFATPTTVYYDAPVASYGATFFVQRTTDGGNNWTTITTGLNAGNETSVFYPPFVMDPSSSNRLLLATSRVYESTNQGDLWKAISTPGINGWTANQAIDAVAVAPSDGNTIYAATTDGHIFVTTNDGLTWRQRDVPGFTDQFLGIAIDPTNNLKAYAVRDRFTGAAGGHVFETTDGGQSWTDISGNLPDVPATAILLDPRDGALYVGTDAGVYASGNGGASWAPFQSGLPNVRINSLAMNTRENVLAAGTNGRGVWEIAVTTLSVTASNPSVGQGVAFNLTISAQDAFGKLLTSYTGTIHFSSTDSLAGLPGDYTFTSSDQGTHTFNVMLSTGGNQSITATDTLNNGVTGSATAPAIGFRLSSIPSPIQAGTPVSFSVTVVDPFGDVAVGYTGLVHFSSTDGRAVLPGDSRLVNGTGTFSINFRDAGIQAVTVTGAGTPALSATQTGIIVIPAPVVGIALSGLFAFLPSGRAETFTVTAQNVFGDPVDGYLGTVHFSSSDGAALLPPEYTFALEDHGVHTFTVTFMTGGPQTFTVSDAAHGFQDMQSGITVLQISGPNQLYVAQLYRDLLHREVDPNGLLFFSTQLDQNLAGRVQVALEIEGSQEYETDAVSGLYQQLFGTAPDATALQAGVSFLAQAGTLTQLEANLLGSPTYFAGPGGGTNMGFLSAVYQTVLGRPLDAVGGMIFGNELASGTPPAAVALSILQSQESEILQINDLYQTLLHRAADPSGLSFFETSLQQGVRIESLIGLMVASAEYAAAAGGDGNQIFVMHVYQDLLNRPAEASVVTNFGAQLDAGALTRGGLVSAVESSAEYRVKLVDNLYSQLLGRQPDSVSLKNWISFLSQGGTSQQVEAQILGSSEYFAGHGAGTNAGFLQALYRDLLHRQIDATGLRVFNQALASGVSRTGVAASLLSSAEFETLEIQSFYTQFLHRPADAAGASANLSLLQNGTSLEDVIALFLTSPEYFARS